MDVYIVKELDWDIDVTHGIFGSLKLADECFETKASQPLVYGRILRIVKTTIDEMDPDMELVRNLNRDD